MMLYSYAACLAAVTLRLYVPFLTVFLGDYTRAYQIVAWLSWVPNLVIARILISILNRDSFKKCSKPCNT